MYKFLNDFRDFFFLLPSPPKNKVILVVKPGENDLNQD